MEAFYVHDETPTHGFVRFTHAELNVLDETIMRCVRANDSNHLGHIAFALSSLLNMTEEERMSDDAFYLFRILCARMSMAMRECPPLT